ncbi:MULTISPECIES: acyltransferase [unclassified Bradyrhizobium]|uniref:acyltransferase family protein n=1 Tax=unclassified Bradyrhizobium TaxID=2631580 RepID=UPI002478B3B5|nr:MULTISPECIES: acyltransferase [unclassified Bradyrhizobium]WGR69677.1 acyltransferase [Bradyrhizobium sp. ISRA426]WGR81734.1 acyltransferase [Bradyrhizobium sp. ISRA430]WGR84919.1 acyltransferase [Bradyrhizobium sp. ISRA432]
MTSIDDKWKASNGRPAGFDLLRITLAIAVILWHSVAVCYGLPAEQWFYGGSLKPLVWLIVPAFFALSGFLVAGSLERNDLPSFVTLRVIRIFPALTAEVAISAILIGPFLTNLPPARYFSDPDFFRYFLNAIGDIHFYLPGVFSDLPVSNMVNSQLWTVPHELECYLAISSAALIGLAKRHRRFFFAVLFIILAFAIRDMLSGKPGAPAAPPGRLLVLAFLCGVALFLNRSRIVYSHWLLLISVTGFVVAVLTSTRAGEDLAAIFIAYLTVYLGLLNFSIGPITKVADYSYGVYLYGFPVQQTVAQLMPGHRIWYINFGISLAVTFVFAMASWHLLESKVMTRKKRVLVFVAALKVRLRNLVALSRGPLVRRSAEARAAPPR